MTAAPTMGIAYAYPTSPTAARLGKGKAGCYYTYRTTKSGKHQPLTAYGSQQEAAEALEKTTHTLDFWSITAQP